MRAYFFGNMYLSSIQQGIQAAHVVAEMFIKYPIEVITDDEDILYMWAESHKTMILLNAGYAENLHNLVGMLHHDENPYPFAPFKESAAALDGAITSVGIILPEKIYEGAKRKKHYGAMPDEEFVLWRDHNTLIFDGEEVVYSDWEVDLMKTLSSAKLAS